MVMEVPYLGQCGMLPLLASETVAKWQHVIVLELMDQ